jgi:hypothetical protein
MCSLVLGVGSWLRLYVETVSPNESIDVDCADSNKLLPDTSSDDQGKDQHYLAIDDLLKSALQTYSREGMCFEFTQRISKVYQRTQRHIMRRRDVVSILDPLGPSFVSS